MKAKLLIWVIVLLLALAMVTTAVAKTTSKTVVLGIGDKLTVQCPIGTVYLVNSQYGEWIVACSD